MRKAFKILAISILAVLVLIIAALGASVWILTPDRLTPLVNDTASKQMNASVSTSRVELTFWKTFPRLVVEVDSLHIISHSLDGIANTPAGADSLASLAHFRAGIDVLSLIAGNINLYDVELHSPKLNIVQVDSVNNNYNIFPPSEEPKEKKPLSLPDITINRFVIADGFPISFHSVPDSLKFNAHLQNLDLNGNGQPVYKLTIDGSGGANLPEFLVPSTPFGINGAIHWQASQPGAIELEQFTVNADKVAASINAKAQLLDTLAINKLKIEGRDIELNNLISLVPDKLRGDLSKINTNLRATVTAELLAPYIPSSGKIPAVDLHLAIPPGQLAFSPLNLQSIETEIKATVHPSDPDRSIIDIKKLAARGQSIDFSLSAHIVNPLSNPYITGTFRGEVSFDRFPEKLTSQLPAKITGTLDGKADFRFRAADLTAANFTKIVIDGILNLRNFRALMNDGSGELYSRHAMLRLGTNSSVKINGQRIDSLLTANLEIDTLAAAIPGVSLTGSALKMGIGAKNESSLLDTTQITPIGISLSAQKLNLRSDSDSIKLTIREPLVRASISRFKNQGKSPLMRLNIDMKSLRMADRLNRLTLRDLTSNFTVHPKLRPRMSAKMQAAYDSVAALNPSLSADSIMRIAVKNQHRRNTKRTARTKNETLDFGLDNSLRSYLRMWQAEGTLKARRARLFTPYFPVKNTISNLDLYISTDSIKLNDTHYKMGESDFLINGSITNISKALTSRRGSPLNITFDVKSDTLDINDITRTLMMGSAFADKINRGEARMTDAESDEAMQNAINAQTNQEDRAAVLIPTNIKANVAIRAKNMKYGDIMFQRFVGRLEAENGAVHLNRLGAFTPMGSLGMEALYSAPNKEDIRFAAGVVIRKLDLHQFLRMLPEIDSVLPMLQSMEGIIDAECALSTQLDSLMNLRFNTLDMALKLSGDSLVLLDSDTFRKISKWLLFKHKDHNMIDSMSVELRIRDSKLQLYPFLVDFDRYRFGISGGNDMGLNLDYHIAVLKSPIPFKFGVNIKGTPEHLKIRLGKARFNENEVASSRQLTDTARINLINEIQRVFKFGVKNSRNIRLTASEPKPSKREFENADTISAADSLFFIRQGIITPPPGWIDPDSVAAIPADKRKKRKK